MDAGRIVELHDGTKALIRPIGPGDSDRLKEGFESSSERSRYLRFLSPQPKLSTRQLQYLTDVDHDHHEAFIAVDPESGQSFGTARYVRDETDPASAEFAVGVGDRWMRLGLATELMRALVERAKEAGVTRFIGVIHEENQAIRGLVQKVAGSYETRTAGWGAREIVVDVTATTRTEGV
jgi:RimJ/RimL family protein N-acetyltransferase